HRFRCSGEVHALKTRLRGASKMRVMVSSRSDASVAPLLLAPIGLLLLLHLAQIFLEAIETLLPKTAIVLDPLRSVLEGTRFQPTRTPLRLAPACNQTRALQHLKMLGDRGQPHPESPP